VAAAVFRLLVLAAAGGGGGGGGGGGHGLKRRKAASRPFPTQPTPHTKPPPNPPPPHPHPPPHPLGRLHHRRRSPHRGAAGAAQVHHPRHQRGDAALPPAAGAHSARAAGVCVCVLGTHLSCGGVRFSGWGLPGLGGLDDYGFGVCLRVCL